MNPDSSFLKMTSDYGQSAEFQLEHMVFES